MKKLKIAWFYPQELNLYGDTGNIIILEKRSIWRGFDVEVVKVNTQTNVQELKGINMVFMGGGPDQSQVSIYTDLINKKASFLKSYYNSGGVGLFICGAFQLMCEYYELPSGQKIKGLGIFDAYTKSAGVREKRLVGNVKAELNEDIFSDLKKFYNLKTIKGFENHGGRTYLGEKEHPLANVLDGNGNNEKDRTEGLINKNFVCSYFHGPFLHMNYHIADYLISKALGTKITSLEKLDDSIERSVHENRY